MIRTQCHCGETYISDNKHVGKHIQCRKCKSVLAIHENVAPVPSVSEKKETEARSTHQPFYYSKTLSPFILRHLREGIFVVVALALVAFMYVYFSSSTRSSLPTPSAQPPTSETRNATPALRIPASDPEPKNPRRLLLGAAPLGPGVRRGNSSLTIDNGTDTDALVLVFRADVTEELVRNFFVPSGQKFTAKRLPPGDYRLRVAFGQDWNDQEWCFNFQESFGKSEIFNITETTWDEPTEDGYIKHTQASRMSITLHKVLHGNFKSHPISKKEFWQSLSSR